MMAVRNILTSHSRQDCAQSGFTLVETMMALLILVLLMGIVASGIPVASETYEKSVDAANAEVALTTTAAKLRDELGLAQDVFYEKSDDAEHTVVYYKRSDGYWAKIVNPTGNVKKSLCIQTYNGEPDVTQSEEPYGLVEAGSPIPLIPDNTMVGNLKVSLGDTPNITYNSKTGVFTVNGLKVLSTKGTTETTLADTGKTTTAGVEIDNPLKIKAALY